MTAEEIAAELRQLWNDVRLGYVEPDAARLKAAILELMLRLLEYRKDAPQCQGH